MFCAFHLVSVDLHGTFSALGTHNIQSSRRVDRTQFTHRNRGDGVNSLRVSGRFFGKGHQGFKGFAIKLRFRCEVRDTFVAINTGLVIGFGILMHFHRFV
ncbi:Uncharacterised protein [Vibrio cholerae]|uniref:Uncharacterized protein n=1 Tax=Vibrio cholerae TaxID=666 RepID=A0A655P759_VIBCL|nr:Uncharacterised protein [Vibrio cholerae]CRZ97533.1 Uncharacterised protein [Vibrio cholerae]CSB42116.1 Uncharacterised protein [Vibrio cholerae]CSB55022.1 Uncharacterised protein [Vibrio cholerae]CSC30847.1 Uncharacterised protein [Vibrio cholerae]